jgi:hypothetical protein
VTSQNAGEHFSQPPAKALQQRVVGHGVPIPEGGTPVAIIHVLEIAVDELP